MKTRTLSRIYEIGYYYYFFFKIKSFIIVVVYSWECICRSRIEENLILELCIVITIHKFYQLEQDNDEKNQKHL